MLYLCLLSHSPNSPFNRLFNQLNSLVFPELSVFFLCVITVYFCKVRWVKMPPDPASAIELSNREAVVALFRCSILRGEYLLGDAVT